MLMLSKLSVTLLVQTSAGKVHRFFALQITCAESVLQVSFCLSRTQRYSVDRPMTDCRALGEQ